MNALYDLIELYEVPTPPEDFAVYQSLGPSITRVRNAIDKSLAERDGNVDKFCVRLDKDIAELSREVKEVKQEAQNPMVLDSTSDPAKVKALLVRLAERIDELEKRAFTFKSYQKNFKVSLVEVSLPSWVTIAYCVSEALLSSRYKYSSLTDHKPVDFQIDNSDIFPMIHCFGALCRWRLQSLTLWRRPLLR